MPTSASLAEAAEHVMTVLQHCNIRLGELGDAADPARKTAVQGFRAGRRYATLANRHLAEALEAAVALEADPDTAGPAHSAAERTEQDKLSPRILASAAIAYNSLVAGWREVAEIREGFPPLGAPHPPTATARHARPAPAAAAVQSPVVQTGGRHR
ncbi:hypothetical protein ACFV4P_31210 [Kitasatospora sp. NPDC059795]|uniref:hypothetical protein n=1 Tax=Kitasatospora sp. NPDC059795 TaxID=3346949 RepID=UPI0036644FF9